MSRERLYLFDTTLRDGAQTQGVDFAVSEKQRIAAALDDIGIDYVEGGWPGANPGDTAFFAEKPSFQHTKFTAFCMTKRAGRSLSNDPGFANVLKADVDAVSIVGKSWDFQVDVALNIPREDNLQSITESVTAGRDAGHEVLFDAEHFFDGYKANPDYAIACLKAAQNAGAAWLVLCDTNGGTMPEDIFNIIRALKTELPEAHIGIHAHNDCDMAVAVSLAAVRAGARMIQGTINGVGERCGNANLCSLIPTFVLKAPYADQFETGISRAALPKITPLSRLLDDILNQSPARHAPYVGPSAFAHKGGLHSSAMLKDSRTYEHVPPESVGNSRNILVSNQAGRSNLVSRLKKIGIAIDPKDPRLASLLEEIKNRESLGYTYDGVGASFELFARETLGAVPRWFEVMNFRAIVEKRHNAVGKLVTVSEATVRLKVDGDELYNVGTGHGPVDALNTALHKDLVKYRDVLKDVTLVDYKVRILTSGTEAITRVVIESKDGSGEHWFTVGVSENIVDASFEALLDAIRYKLLRQGIG